MTENCISSLQRPQLGVKDGLSSFSGTKPNNQFKQFKQDLPFTSESSRWKQEDRFPWKMHRMLNDAEINGFAHIVSWMPDDVAFRVHDKDLFAKEVLSLYFRQSKYKSFQRQLNMWGFERVNGGAYSHKCFVRGQVDLCQNMKRLKIKGTRPPALFLSRTSPKPSGPRSEDGSPLRVVTPNTPRCKAPESLDTVADVIPPLPSTRSRAWCCPQPHQEDLFDEETLSSVLLLDSATMTHAGSSDTQQECDAIIDTEYCALEAFITQSVSCTTSDSASRPSWVTLEGECGQADNVGPFYF